MQRDVLRATGRRRWVLPIRVPGTASIRRGGMLPATPRTLGTRSWESYLSEAVSTG
ncbi:hypothetical protein [Dactylosporangium salmoneum]|uniref:Uncharacterized protein n=1 Tax=Dactylosporangium salmoneum TaxID=53361 RepID=A0ABN3I0B7_9ACTN